MLQDILSPCLLLLPLFYFGQNCLSSSGSKGLIVIEISKGPFLKEEPVNLGKGGATLNIPSAQRFSYLFN